MAAIGLTNISLTPLLGQTIVTTSTKFAQNIFDHDIMLSEKGDVLHASAELNVVLGTYPIFSVLGFYAVIFLERDVPVIHFLRVDRFTRGNECVVPL